jgi:hypothetical protein
VVVGGGGVKGKVFSMIINLVGYNFELILSPDFDKRLKVGVKNI